jgi:hypothetical protein
MSATTISRANIGTNDDGSGTTGTVVNVAYVGLLYDNIDALFSSTTGLTLNQAAGDTEILTFESSDVAHGITTLAPTDRYAQFLKASGTLGGLIIRGLSEGTQGLVCQGYVTTDDTTKSTAAVAHIMLTAATKSGTTVGAVGANGNMLCVQNFATTRFILDGDGDSHQDVGTAWTNFDSHDDIALLQALAGAVSRMDDPLKATFGGWLTRHRAVLERERIVTINDHLGGDGSVFINWSRAQMLAIGAIRQLGARLAALEARA